MLGPLPQLHRSLVVAITVVTCAAIASWVAHDTALQLAVAGATVLGALVGVPLALLVVQPPQRELRTVRVLRRH